ncbi:accessory gene regulator B family protein [Paenibacillus sp. NRS-1783]|uniref:accessory gene regulator B family protein n=1 Tax=Paenibacillus sp. NRS-1783 TaxID=3233907 RepID=UPI003D275301
MMLEQLSRNIARRIKNADPDGPVSVEVMEYALAKRLNYLATILLTLLGGMVTGKLAMAMLALVLFWLIRKASGGVHIKSLTVCAVISASMFCIIPQLYITNVFILVLTGAATLLYGLYAPSRHEDLNPSRLEPYLRVISVIICSSNFFFQSSVFAWVLVAQALLILPLWKETSPYEAKNS